MKGKLIVIEGTDCSGKQTHSELLLEKLNNSGYKTKKYAFPNYDSPTGKIIAGPYLGKEEVSKGWFKEGASNVNPFVASLYFAADRLYNIDDIKKDLDNGYNVILDRYTTSNMGHQAGKLKTKEERLEMFKWIEKLEFELLSLPRPDIKILLYMPYELSKELQKNRISLDEHEKSEDNIKNALLAYQELSIIYDFKVINCSDKDNNLLDIKAINENIFNYVIHNIKGSN